MTASDFLMEVGDSIEVHSSPHKFRLTGLVYPKQHLYYFGGARSKGFATLRNVSKLQFFDKIGQAKSVGFRFYSAI